MHGPCQCPTAWQQLCDVSTPDLRIVDPASCGCLRTAEIKRLFTYPDEFELVGSRSSIQAQLGNSVPPLLAEKVIKALPS